MVVILLELLDKVPFTLRNVIYCIVIIDLSLLGIVLRILFMKGDSKNTVYIIAIL